jgi:hypothetical protein
LAAGHALGHDDVREQQIHGVVVLPPEFQRGRAGGGLEDVVIPPAWIKINGVHEVTR